MLRRTFVGLRLSRKGSKRSWSNPQASTHFPAQVAQDVQLDPALERADVDAKERKTFNFLNMRRGDFKVVETLNLWYRLIRMDKPVGTRLLFLPCLWGSSLAVTKTMVYTGADWASLMAPFVPAHQLVLFYVGAHAMRSAGCIVNDMWDRDFDKLVERTKDRPLASGALSMRQATGFLCVHMIQGGLVVLLLNPVASATAICALPLVVAYPLMKRFTNFPQVFLGLTMNWGIFVGYAAVTGGVDLAVTVPMYVGAAIWTVLYDTIYAYQDRADDIKAGIKSTAVKFGNSKMLLYPMVASSSLCFMMAGLAAGQSIGYHLGMCLAGGYLFLLVDHVNINDPWSCGHGFRRNVRYGFLVFLAMVAGNLVWVYMYERRNEYAKFVDGNPTLAKFMCASVKRADYEYDARDFNIQDRLMKPIYVHTALARSSGVEDSEYDVPDYMRREFSAFNIGLLMKYLLRYSDEEVEEWQQKWYSVVEHYNIVTEYHL